MKATLCRIDAWSADTPTTFRLSNIDDERVCHLDNASWRPAIARLPKLRYDFFDGSFGSQLSAPTGEMVVQLAAWPDLPALELYDARVRLWQGELGAAWGDYALIFDGRVRDQPPTAEGASTLSIGCDDAWLDEPLLRTYAGTGNAEGSVDLKGNIKPWLIGAPRFVEPVLIDAVDNIYQLSDGQMWGAEEAFDRLSRLGPPVADHASFAALKAATIANGEWATCLALGLIRLGAPPAGLLTFHAQGDNSGSRGWVRNPGSIIFRIAERLGKLDRVVVADLDALDAACPYNLSLALTGQTTARDVILGVAQSVNAVALIDWLGRLRVKPVQIGAAIGTLASDGSSWPPVASVEQMTVSTPYWRLAQKAAITHRVHSLAEMALNDPALAAAIAAQEAADEASIRIGRITSDGWLTAGADKQSLVREYDSISTRFTAAYDKAADLDVAASERATAQADMEALFDFLEAITPDWDNTGVDSPVDGPELDSLFYAASVTVAILESAVRGLPGADGAPGADGPPGADGAPGEDGYNSAVVFLFKRSASLPAVPSTIATYTFASGILTGHNNGWAQEPASGTDPLYVITATARSQLATDTIESIDWVAPRILVQNGDGPAGAPAPSIEISRKAVNIWAYANGGVVSWADANGLLKVRQGNVDVTASATLSASSSGLTGTINHAAGLPVAGQPKGYYRVTAMPGDSGTLTLTAVIDGVTLTESFSVSKTRGGYEIVSSLPASDLFEGRIVYLTTDDKLYRFNGTVWTAALSAADLTGQITTTQIADNAISTPKLAAGSVVAGKIATNAVTADKIDAGAVTAGKIAVTQLSAISAIIGVLETAPTGARLRIQDNLISGFYPSGNICFRLGVW